MIVLLHWLRADVDPAVRIMSEYAVGPYGSWMTSTFFVLALALLALGIGLTRSLPAPARSSAGIALLLLAAVASGTAGFFPTDVGVWKPQTAAGWVHRIAGAGIVFPSITLAALLISWRSRQDAGWRDVAWIGLLVGSVGFLLFAAIPLFLFERNLAGVAQRVLMALFFTWMLVVSHRIIVRAA